MRIGIDLRLPTYQMGGISQYALHLLPALAALDSHNEYVVFHHVKERRLFTPQQPNFRSARLFTPCHHRWEREALSLELLPHRLDVWHSPDFIPPRRGARRHVATIHDLNFLHDPDYLTADARRYYNDQIAWAVRRADMISADSESTRRDIINLLGAPPERVRTVYLAANPLYACPVEPSAVAETLRRYDLPRGFLLYVGAIEPRKNVPVLLRAYDVLRREWGVDRPLVLIGRRGPLADDVFTLIDALHLQPFVRHLTGVGDVQLAHLYHAAALLALPSLFEGFGLPPLEALHCGCPVVSSDRGSLPEIVGDAGFLLDPHDIPAWVDALYTVLSDDAVRAGMQQRGFLQAARFTWSAAAAATLELYGA